MSLTPCPFCGGKRPKLVSQRVEHSRGGPDFVAHVVRCQRISCGAAGPQFEQHAEYQIPDPGEEAVTAWNKRAS